MVARNNFAYIMYNHSVRLFKQIIGNRLKNFYLPQMFFPLLWFKRGTSDGTLWDSEIVLFLLIQIWKYSCNENCIILFLNGFNLVCQELQYMLLGSCDFWLTWLKLSEWTYIAKSCICAETTQVTRLFLDEFLCVCCSLETDGHVHLPVT